MKLESGQEVAPGIIIYNNVVNSPEKIIEMSQLDKENWRESRINSSLDTSGLINKSVRNTKVLDIPGIYSNDIFWFTVSQKIWQYAHQYALNFNISFSNMESAQILHYPCGEGFYKPHVDDEPGSHRIFSALLYLNDVEDGGETYFNKFDISIKPKAGTLALFPANYIYIHEARTPKSNDKFVIVAWFNPVP